MVTDWKRGGLVLHVLHEGVWCTSRLVLLLPSIQTLIFRVHVWSAQFDRNWNSVEVEGVEMRPRSRQQIKQLSYLLIPFF